MVNYTANTMTPMQRKYADVYRLFLTELPPPEFCCDSNTIGPAAITLQDWIGAHLRDSVNWATALAVMDAVDAIVKESVQNGNIDSFGNVR